jgi:hypothetical protein
MRHLPDIVERVHIMETEMKGKVCVFDTEHDYINHQYPCLSISASSTEIAIQLLAHCGVKRMSFTGIDGGSKYHDAFGSSGGKVTCSGQFIHFRNLQKIWGLEYFGLPAGAIGESWNGT